MIITNKLGLPDMLQRAVEKEYTYRNLNLAFAA